MGSLAAAVVAAVATEGLAKGHLAGSKDLALGLALAAEVVTCAMAEDQGFAKLAKEATPCYLMVASCDCRVATSLHRLVASSDHQAAAASVCLAA